MYHIFVNANNKNIKHRYIISLISNVVRGGLSFLTSIIIARYLSPDGFGQFNFVLSIFASLFALVGVASSSAFYTFLSTRKRGLKFYFFYMYLQAGQLLALILFIILSPSNVWSTLFLNTSKQTIFWALFASFMMTKLFVFTTHAGESIRDTLGVQVRNIIFSLAYLVIILVLGWFQLISINNLLILNLVLYGFISVSYYVYLEKLNLINYQLRESYKSIFIEYKNYCGPMVVYSIATFLYIFADRWLLQYFGGAAQQGYYFLGLKFATAISVVTISLSNVLWKEISEACHEQNIKRVSFLYTTTTKIIFLIVSASVFMIIPYTKEIIWLAAGSAYHRAWLPTAIMFFYPIHQSLGQISGVTLMALGETKAKGIIGLLFVSASIPISYLFIAPNSAIIPGLDLGALGMSLKMVILQIIEVNLMMFIICKKLKTEFFGRHQLLVPIYLLAWSYTSKAASTILLEFISISNNDLITMMLGMIIYAPVVGFCVLRFPTFVGLKRDDIRRMLPNYVKFK